MDRVGPTNPFHLSKAYGASRAQAASNVSFGASSSASTSPLAFPTRATPAKTDSVDASAPAQAAKQRISGLVAARVTEQPDASAVTRPTAKTAATMSQGASFPMYRHPADKNAAATAVDAGRVIDLNA